MIRRPVESPVQDAALCRPIVFYAITLVFAGLAGCYLDTPPSPPDQIGARLVALLSDKDPDVRRTAAESLGKIALPSAEDRLRGLLNDPSSDVRAAAVEALGRLGPAVSTETILGVAAKLEDQALAVRQAAARAFGEWEPVSPVAARLTAFLRSPDAATRRQAVHALLLLDVPAAGPALIEALNDPDSAVRQGAVAALGESGDPAVVPFILKRLTEDPAHGVRAEAAYRLGKIRAATVREKLVFVAATDGDPGVRRWARAASEELTSRPDSGSER